MTIGHNCIGILTFFVLILYWDSDLFYIYIKDHPVGLVGNNFRRGVDLETGLEKPAATLNSKKKKHEIL